MSPVVTFDLEGVIVAVSELKCVQQAFIVKDVVSVPKRNTDQYSLSGVSLQFPLRVIER